ncbi:hypothetical protein D9M73_133620 [compost metagenome]
MIHRLLGRQLGDRRQDAISVRRQHHHVARHRPHIVFRRIGNEVDRIGTATVLGEARIVEIEHARHRVHHHIFEDRAKAFGGREDFRLGIGRQADHLGIAAALEIEDGGV